jgi:hypothetical protein
LELTDMSGKKVWLGNMLLGKGSFDLSHLSNGVYILHYFNQSSSGVQRIIKQ